MDISQLRSFVAVAEAGSYIKAADLLSMPQPTLSRQVRSLEVSLRANLFHRNGRGVILTDQGKKFIEYARSILHTLDAAVLSVRDSDAEYTGSLLIGLTPSIARIIVPTLAPRLKERFPKAKISIAEGLSGQLYEKVLLGQLDFAILLNPAFANNIQIEPLAVENLYLVGQHPVGEAAEVELKHVAGLPLIMPHSNQWTRPAFEAAVAKQGLNQNLVLELDATFSILELAAQGFGYSIMPGSLRQVPSIPEMSWQKVVNPPLEATLSAITPSKKPLSRLALDASAIVKSTFLEFFKDKQ